MAGNTGSGIRDLLVRIQMVYQRNYWYRNRIHTDLPGIRYVFANNVHNTASDSCNLSSHTWAVYIFNNNNSISCNPFIQDDHNVYSGEKVSRADSLDGCRIPEEMIFIMLIILNDEHRKALTALNI